MIRIRNRTCGTLLDETQHVMRPLLLFALLFGCTCVAISQSKPSEEDLELLAQYETDIEARLAQLNNGQTDDTRLAHADTLHQLIVDAVNTRGSFEYPFEGISRMGILTSPDAAFRLFNWNVSLLDETHKYYCILLYGEEQQYNWVELQAMEREAPGVERKVLNEEKWLGCLYYEIIPIKVRRKTKYTLLGWDGHNKQSTRKIIEVLGLDDGNVRFGANVFKTEKGSAKRHLLEYSSEVMVSCKYDAKGDRIVMDHLEPQDPVMKGVFAYYGPDLTFDAYVWEKGKWVYYRDVDVRMGRDAIQGPYNDPQKRK